LFGVGSCDNLLCNGDFETFTPRVNYYWAEAGRILVSENPSCLFYNNPIGCLEDYGDLCVIAPGVSQPYFPHCIEGLINPPGSAGEGAIVNEQLYYAPNLNSWQSYQVEWINDTGDPMNWIIFDLSQDIRIDDIVAAQSCPVTVEIETEEETDVCNLSVTEICFDVCVDDMAAGTEVELEATIELPAGFVITDGNAATVATAVGETEGNISASIAPNPVTGGVALLKLQALVNLNAPQIILRDALGREVLRERLRVVDGKVSQELKIGHLVAGVYFCSVEDGGVAVWQGKVIKQ